MGETGWFAYTPLTDVAGYAHGNGNSSNAEVNGRFEAADVGRLARRGMRSVVKAARADLAPTVTKELLDHLGPVPGDVAVVAETWAAYELVNVQAGLDAWLAEPGRAHRSFAPVSMHWRDFRLGDLLSATGDMATVRPGNVATVNLPCGPDGEVMPCASRAIHLVTEPDGERLALLVLGPERHERNEVGVQAVSTVPGLAAAATARIRELARERNVFRGHVLTFGGDFFDSGVSVLQFHRRPTLDRTGLVLPDGVLDSVERQVLGVGRHRAALLASGQHLKRGLLLYGPPGTGKTHTIRYLLSRAADTTVIQLTGDALRMIAEACSVARALTPSMIVVEDVDLIAEDRDSYGGRTPLLFELLNEMDGLAEDADVVFVLTTNRADLLEPALAARPGRVDQAVELGLPDAAARRALLELYRGALRLPEDALQRMADRTDGVTASFLKELLRRAAVVGADAGAGGDGPVTVAAEHLDEALAELMETRNAMTRAALGAWPPVEELPDRGYA